jgi:hypothetical protein
MDMATLYSFNKSTCCLLPCWPSSSLLAVTSSCAELRVFIIDPCMYNTWVTLF